MRCKCCYPGSPLDQCQLTARHDGPHFMVPRPNSIMWHDAREMTWTDDWIPRQPDEAFLAVCAQSAMFYKVFENPMEMVEIMKRVNAPKERYAV